MRIEPLEDYLFDGDENSVKIFKNMRVLVDDISERRVIYNRSRHEWALLDNDSVFSYQTSDTVKTIGQWRSKYVCTKLTPVSGVKYATYLVSGDMIRCIDGDGITCDYVIMKSKGMYYAYNTQDMNNVVWTLEASHALGLTYEEIKNKFSIRAKLYYCGNISSLFSDYHNTKER